MSENIKNLPIDETDRIKALEKYENVEEGIVREEVFDRLAALTALICNASVAFIKLIGQDKQYAKASIIRTGTEGEESAGLGMFMVKKYISLLKGMIKITSEVDEGTKVNVKISI